MQPSTTPESAPERTRILLVEDVVNVATVLKARLEFYNYEVCDIARTGHRAIACALEYKPHLILMDILLEGDMNGIEAAKKIGERMDIPIVYLSCVNDRVMLDQALETNPYGFILKPYDNTELRFAIENALQKHHAFRTQERRIADLERNDHLADGL
jgi:DNA-binding NarL/FixJ family response regulator